MDPAVALVLIVPMKTEIIKTVEAFLVIFSSLLRVLTSKKKNIFEKFNKF